MISKVKHNSAGTQRCATIASHSHHSSLISVLFTFVTVAAIWLPNPAFFLSFLCNIVALIHISFSVVTVLLLFCYCDISALKSELDSDSDSNSTCCINHHLYICPFKYSLLSAPLSAIFEHYWAISLSRRFPFHFHLAFDLGHEPFPCLLPSFASFLQTKSSVFFHPLSGLIYSLSFLSFLFFSRCPLLSCFLVYLSCPNNLSTLCMIGSCASLYGLSLLGISSTVGITLSYVFKIYRISWAIVCVIKIILISSRFEKDLNDATISSCLVRSESTTRKFTRFC